MGKALDQLLGDLGCGSSPAPDSKTHWVSLPTPVKH